MDRRSTLGVMTDANQRAQGSFAKPSRPSHIPRPSVGGMVTAKSRPSNVFQLSKQMNMMSLETRPSIPDRRASVRQSIDNRRRSSVAQRSLQPPSMPLKDPRPVRDKNYQMACVKMLIKFLSESGYEKGSLSAKNLTSPSAKDFFNIFTFLYSLLDPDYKFEKKLEEELPVILRSVKYPFASDIGRTQLMAVGTMHTWGTMLGMLIWLTELIMCVDQINIDDQLDAAVENSPDRMFYDYLCKAYQVFLQDSDQLPSVVSELEASFESRNQEIVEEIQSLSAENERLQEEFAFLTQEESPLAKAQSILAITESDLQKYRKFIQSLESKEQKLRASIERLVKDEEVMETEIEENDRVKQELLAQVEAQPISPEDIDRMNSERDILLKQSESISLIKEDLTQKCWDREVTVQKKMTSVDKLCSLYHRKGEELKIIPKEAMHSQGVDFQINLDILEYYSIMKTDIPNHIKPSLTKLYDFFNSCQHSTQDSLFNLQDSLDRLVEVIQEKQEEVDALESTIGDIQAQYEEEKTKAQEAMSKANENLKKFENEIKQMKAQGRALVETDFTIKRLLQDLERLEKNIKDDSDRIIKESTTFGEEVTLFLSKVDNIMTTLEEHLDINK